MSVPAGLHVVEHDLHTERYSILHLAASPGGPIGTSVSFACGRSLPWGPHSVVGTLSRSSDVAWDAAAGASREQGSPATRCPDCERATA